VPAGVPYNGSVSGSRRSCTRTFRVKVGNADSALDRSRRSLIVADARSCEFGIDSCGIEPLLLEILGSGFASHRFGVLRFAGAW
jgi:hypothetical protein